MKHISKILEGKIEKLPFDERKLEIMRRGIENAKKKAKRKHNPQAK